MFFWGGAGPFPLKLECHAAAVSLFVAHYNFCRVHEALTPDMRHQNTPAWRLGLRITCGRLANCLRPRLQLRRRLRLRLRRSEALAFAPIPQRTKRHDKWPVLPLQVAGS